MSIDTVDSEADGTSQSSNGSAVRAISVSALSKSPNAVGPSGWPIKHTESANGSDPGAKKSAGIAGEPVTPSLLMPWAEAQSCKLKGSKVKENKLSWKIICSLGRNGRS